MDRIQCRSLETREKLAQEIVDTAAAHGATENTGTDTYTCIKT